MTDENKNNEQNDARFDKETQSGFVKGIVESFDKFVDVFKRQGLGFVAIVLVFFMVFYSYILHPLDISKIVTDALNKEKVIETEMQQRSINQRLQSDKIMLNIMQELSTNYGVDQSLLFELHNSTQNISGVEFLYMSASYEVLNPDDYELEYIADNFQKQYLTQIIGTETFNKLKHADYLYFDNLDRYHRSQYRLISKLKHFGAHSVLLIPFCNQKKIPLLVLVLVSHNDEMNADKIYNYVKTFRSAIEDNLMNI